jgi:hypothetical protein
MLIELGEIVIYLDKTIFPKLEEVDINQSCVKMWKSLITENSFSKETCCCIKKGRMLFHPINSKYPVFRSLIWHILSATLIAHRAKI